MAKKRSQKKETTSFRIASDLVKMANVVGSLQEKAAVDVIDELLRPSLAKVYRAETAKASKGIDDPK